MQSLGLLSKGFSLTAGPSQIYQRKPRQPSLTGNSSLVLVLTPHQTSANCLFHEIRMVKGVVKYTAFAFAVGTQGKPNNCEICGYTQF